MKSDFSDDELRRRLRLLEQQNDYLQQQNDLLQEAIETICAAFLDNSRNLDTAIQTAMTLQQRARLGSDQIQRSRRRRDLEID
jgi:hypothetical protein